MSSLPEAARRLPDAILDELETAVGSLPAEDLPAMVGRLAATQAAVLLRLAEAGRGVQHDELLDVGAAAKAMGVTEQWLYAHHGGLPFTVRNGRLIRFSRAGIDRWIKRGGRRGLR